jgi:hypothetical protein
VRYPKTIVWETCLAYDAVSKANQGRLPKPYGERFGKGVRISEPGESKALYHDPAITLNASATCVAAPNRLSKNLIRSREDLKKTLINR